MLQEPVVIKARHIAVLAARARAVRDRLLEKVPDAVLGEPMPARGEHNPSAIVALNGVLEHEPAFVTLREAIMALPRTVRDRLAVVQRVGRGEVAILDWDDALAEATLLRDEDITAAMIGDADLHDHLRKCLYVLGS